MVAIGKMDRVIEVIPQGVTKGRAGAPILSPGLPIKMWAAKKVAKQETRYLADKEQLFSDCSFTVHFRNDITNDAKVKCEGTTFNIVHIAEVGYKEALILYCKASDVRGAV